MLFEQPFYITTKIYKKMLILTQKPKQLKDKMRTLYKYKRKNYYKSYYKMLVQILFLKV